MIGLADFYKTIAVAWNAANLDAPFTAYWSIPNRLTFTVLNDHMAEGAQPFPYCVLRVEEGKTETRMTSGTHNVKREIRRLPVRFTVHARDMASGKSAKLIAAELAAEITKVFGGHPTEPPRIDGRAMDNGHVLIAQYQGETAVREGTEVYGWVVRYFMTLDVPVRVGHP
jgi:hypothetical protein